MAGETHAHAFAWHVLHDQLRGLSRCLNTTTTFPPRLCAISITQTSSFSRLPFAAHGTPPTLHYTISEFCSDPASVPSATQLSPSTDFPPPPRTTPPPPSRIRKFLHQHRSTTHELPPRWSASPQLPASSVSSRNLTQRCAPSPCTG